jgi:hypothetical protein
MPLRTLKHREFFYFLSLLSGKKLSYSLKLIVIAGSNPSPLERGRGEVIFCVSVPSVAIISPRPVDL